MDRTKTSGLIGGAAVRAAGPGAVQLLLPAPTRVSGELEIHAPAGRRIHATSILRRAQNDRLAARARLCCGTQTSATIAANDGIDGDLCQAAFEPEWIGAPAISISVRGGENPAGQPGLERRHYLYSAARGLCIFGGGVGLVQPVCVGVGAVEQPGGKFLCGGLGTGAGRRTARDIQHGPRCAVYQPAVPSALAQNPNPDQHGWTGSGVRQHLRGTVVAEREVRRGVCPRLPGCTCRSERPAAVLSVLQRGKVSPGMELSNAAKRVSGSEMRTEVIGGGPQGARAKAQSSPPATFNLLITIQVGQEFHYLKSPEKLSGQWGVPQTPRTKAR